MAIPRAPSKVIQQRIFAKSLHEQTPSTDLWEYAIAHDWFKQYVSKIAENDSASIDMDRLYVSVDNAANTFIEESRWKVLVSWFGIADNSSILRIPMFPNYIPVPLPTNQEHVFPDKNLDFLPVSIGRLEELDNPKYFQYVHIYFWEQFSFLELIARRLLKIPSTSNVRMWISLTEKGKDVFFKNVDPCLVSWFSCLGSLVCAENMFVLNELGQRQAAMQGPPQGTPEQQPSSASMKSQTALDEIFDRHSLIITICLEELPGNTTDTSPFAKQESFILGEVAPFVRGSAMLQSEWDVALNKGLEQLTLGVGEAVRKETSHISDQAGRIVNYKVDCLDDQKAELEKFETTLLDKEEKLNSFEKSINERDGELSYKISKFKENLTDFLTQKKRLEDELKRLEQQNTISASKVELNVGGVRYTTSTSTLMNEKDSVLASMFNGHNAVHTEKDGSYFIDRDGTNFRHILNYLREGAIAVESFPAELSFLKELQIEARYYNLMSLMAALQTKIEKTSRKN